VIELGCNRASVACWWDDTHKGGHPMTRVLRLTAKAALAVVAGYGLYLSSHYSDARSVSKWTTASNGPVRAKASSERLVRAEPGSCASETRPNIAAECIRGRAESVDQAKMARDASSPAIQHHQVSRDSVAADPGSTGSVPVAISPSLAQAADQDLPRAERRKVKKPGPLARGERRRVREVRHRGSFRSHVVQQRPVPSVYAARSHEPREVRHRGSFRSHVVQQRPVPSVYAARSHEPIQFRLADRGN
jgi:hypothetical protein